jgi:hypothetical protein
MKVTNALIDRAIVWLYYQLRPSKRPRRKPQPGEYNPRELPFSASCLISAANVVVNCGNSLRSFEASLKQLSEVTSVKRFTTAELCKLVGLRALPKAKELLDQYSESRKVFGKRVIFDDPGPQFCKFLKWRIYISAELERTRGKLKGE